MKQAIITKDYQSQFKKTHNLDQRILLFKKNRQKYPDCFLLIIEKDPKFDRTKGINKQKFLAKKQAKLVEIQTALRGRLGDIPSSESLYLINQKANKVLNGGTLIQDLWNTDRNQQDNIIYLRYTGHDDKGAQF